jgi:hypothetical protein
MADIISSWRRFMRSILQRYDPPAKLTGPSTVQL